jgi:hypothetical protein
MEWGLFFLMIGAVIVGATIGYVAAENKNRFHRARDERHIPTSDNTADYLDIMAVQIAASLANGGTRDIVSAIYRTGEDEGARKERCGYPLFQESKQTRGSR